MRASILEALDARVEEIVERKLAALGVATARYSTGTRPAVLPAGTRARTFNAWCRGLRVEGARRDGAGWTCTAAAWRAARANGPRREAAKRPQSNDVDSLLMAAGLRGTR